MSTLGGIGALIFFATCCFASSPQQQQQQQPSRGPRIAIIGGGVAAASSAYFLHDLLRQNPAFDARIDVYYPSTDALGGRLAVASFDGREFESGGSIVHEKNLYMRHFAEKVLRLPILHQNEEMRLAVYNGKEAVLDTSDWYLVKMVQLLGRYGVSTFVRLRRFVSDMLHNFARIYARQNRGQAFTTVRGLLAAMSDQFPGLAGQSIEKVLLERGFDAAFINELVAGAMRNNYGQNVSIHGFVGAVSLAGAEGGLWSVSGGNRRVVEGLLDRLVSGSDAGCCRLLPGRRVTRLTRLNGQKKLKNDAEETESSAWRLAFVENAEAAAKEEDYDQVILTAPAHQLFDIQLVGASVSKLDYQTTVATFVKGALNHTGLGLASRQERYTLLTGTPAAPLAFNSVGFQLDVTGRASNGVYKVFSERPLTGDQLAGLFARIDASSSVSWLAYPLYDKLLPAGIHNASFVLAPGLFHTSPVEVAASAMEMSAVAGRNAALLAYNQWLGPDRAAAMIDPADAAAAAADDEAPPPEEWVALRKTEL